MGASKADTRIESDGMGEIEVPADRYWGAQTQRSLRYFDREHDAGEKNVLGEKGPWTAEDIVRILLARPATPLLLVRKFYRLLISESDSPGDQLLEPAPGGGGRHHVHAVDHLNRFDNHAFLAFGFARTGFAQGIDADPSGSRRALDGFFDPGPQPFLRLANQT